MFWPKYTLFLSVEEMNDFILLKSAEVLYRLGQNSYVKKEKLMSPLFYLLHSSANTGKMLPDFPSLCLSSLSVVEYSILPLISDE
jgi:hypothetical protein